MKDKLFKKLEDSCRFLYDNHREILNAIYQDRKIVPLATLLKKYDKIPTDTLLSDNVNSIYNLISVKDPDITLETINDADKTKQLQEELVQKTIQIIENSGQIFNQHESIIDTTVVSDFFKAIKHNQAMKRKFFEELSQNPALLQEILEESRQKKSTPSPSSDPLHPETIALSETKVRD